eukprot:TRINITY_DN21112_c0_g1_i1.p1 TRINITY_DN21112_c0_g1~~TRINITY_DN21112_c0_g1_i1.p1  ORF type:complete len:156 (-),score=29.67 TRINITY_DN21112_c0_g1_i1:399-866(-)
MASGSAVRIPVEDLPKLPVEQLQQIKEQMDNELSVMSDSLGNLRTAMSRVEASANTLMGLSSQTEGKKVLVPMANSLYVPAMLGATETVLVDVGTGYYIQMRMAAGLDYCQRKLAYLKDNYEKVSELYSQKCAQVEKVTLALQIKVRSAAADSPS